MGIMADLKAFYRSNTLAEKLNNIHSFPLVALIAPMGYGKTTALQAYLSDKPSIWVHCGAELPLEELFYGALNLPEETDQFHAIRTIPDETALIFDNYHLCAGVAEQDNFLRDLLILLEGRCHLVLVSRKDIGLTQDAELLLHGMLYRIELEDFILQRDDLQRWFRMCGQPLTPGQSEEIMCMTEGWAALCYLVLIEYSRSGTLHLKNEDALMDLLYTALPENCKKLLWYLSAALDFTEDDAVLLWGSREGLTLIRRLREEGVPILHTSGGWHLQTAFAAYVRRQVELLNETNRSSILRRLGRWYQSRGEERRAAEVYEAAGDWDQLLTLIEEEAGALMSFSYAERVTRLMVLCPKETLARHPVALFYHARQVATLGRPELVQRWRPTDAGQAAEIDLQAAYPDLEQMARYCRAARENAENLLPTWREPFTLGALSLLSAYHKGSGQVETTLKYFEEYINLYIPLSGGHGAGAVETARAEHHLLRGEFDFAEIDAHAAILLAKEGKQASIQIAALFILARCAWLRGDRSDVREYLMQISEKAGVQPLLQQMESMVRGWFLALQGTVDACEKWLKDGNTAALELMPPAQIDFYVVSAMVMLKQGAWTRLIAHSRRWLDTMGVWYSELTVLYLNLCQAAAYAALGMPEKCRGAVSGAIQLAERYGWCVPFLEFWDDLELCWKELEQHPQLFSQLCALTDARASSQTLQIPELSPRENQVAAMICEGASNQEIAAQLAISINTVKTTIRHINAKLQTTNRESLKRRAECL